MSADNIQLDALVDGDDVATDLIATDHYQIIKMTYGALGSQTIASADAGAVDAGTPRVTLGSDDPAVALLGTMDADTGAIKTATETIAAAVSTQMQVDIVADGAGLLTTAAHDAALGIAGTPDAAVRSVQGIAGGTALPVSGTVTANPASGTIDTVTAVTDITNPITANPASGTIDTVTTVSAVTSLDPIVHAENAALGANPSGALAMARQDAALTATGSVDDDATPLTVDANGALWVTPSGTVTVDGSGVTQPVSGTVTANPASGTIDTVTNLAQMGAAAISMNTGVRDAGTQRVTIATNDSVPVTGTVTANPASGTVDTVTTVGTVTNLSQLGGVAVSMNTGVRDTGTQRVTIATNDSVPVTGTVTANLSTTDNNVLDTIVTNQSARATGGHTYYTNLDTSALDTIKNSAGTLYWLHITSTDATPVFVTFYDATSPTLGTAPVLCFPVPTQGDANGAGLTINFGPNGIEFTNSIKVGAATTYNGTTDPGANVVIVNAGFE